MTKIAGDRRINAEIKSPEVRVVGHNGEQLGVMKSADAIRMARQEKLDLVEVAPQAIPPVCKIVDYNKFLFEEKKKAKETAKKNREARIEIKEIWLRPVTDKHDVDIKVKNARSFLAEGDKVRFTLKFRGREISHTEQGRELLESILNKMGDVKVDTPITQSGKQMILVVSPLPSK